MTTSSSPDSGHGRYRIGDITRTTGLTADTLRYYEKIGLLAPVGRNTSGMRLYDRRDLSRLRFIQRAKAMKFSLREIAQLLEMREDPQYVRAEVRELTQSKLQQVEEQIQALNTLRRELTLLVNLCRGSVDGSGGGCPIIQDFDGRKRSPRPDDPPDR